MFRLHCFRSEAPLCLLKQFFFFFDSCFRKNFQNTLTRKRKFAMFFSSSLGNERERGEGNKKKVPFSFFHYRSSGNLIPILILGSFIAILWKNHWRNQRSRARLCFFFFLFCQNFILEKWYWKKVFSSPGRNCCRLFRGEEIASLVSCLVIVPLLCESTSVRSF